MIETLNYLRGSYVGPLFCSAGRKYCRSFRFLLASQGKGVFHGSVSISNARRTVSSSHPGSDGPSGESGRSRAWARAGRSQSDL